MLRALTDESSLAIFMNWWGQAGAVEAVIGEPVSVSHFPVVRENTGKFWRSRLAMAKLPSH